LGGAAVNLGDFKVLSFDCYGTLIDWETGILAALRPLVRRAGITLDNDAVLAEFAAHESAQQAATPAMPYAEVLGLVNARLAGTWGAADNPAENARFGASVGDWPEFPDTVAALRSLGQRYRLVILSNVDRQSFQGTEQRLGVKFDAIHTAQDIGSYKPDPRNFAYLIERLAEHGLRKSDLLHVAQSLYHDHAPANAIGLASAWIDRRHGAAGWGATVPPPAGVRYDFRFNSLAELAESAL
jgi:2-haloalkanoic acid dehalogenase type II